MFHSASPRQTLRACILGALTLAFFFQLDGSTRGEETGKRVLFMYRDAEARTVALAGEFTRGQRIPMSRREDGMWSCWASIPPGTHGYRFLVNDQDWKLDPQNKKRKTVDGIEHSALTVGASPATTAADTPPPAKPATTKPTATKPNPRPAPVARSDGSEARPNIDVNVIKKRNTRLSHLDYDDRQQDVQVQIIITNKELAKEFSALTGDLYVVARDVTDPHAHQLILRNSKTFDLKLRETMEYESDSVRLDFDNNRFGKHGIKYYGYVYILKDSAGKVIVSQGAPDRLVQALETFKDEVLKVPFRL